MRPLPSRTFHVQGSCLPVMMSSDVAATLPRRDTDQWFRPWYGYRNVSSLRSWSRVPGVVEVTVGKERSMQQCLSAVVARSSQAQQRLKENFNAA